MDGDQPSKEHRDHELGKTKRVHFNTKVHVRGVPYEDRSGLVLVCPSPSPARPLQSDVGGSDGFEAVAELLVGFCARVAERRREKRQRRAEQEEEREKMQGL